MKTWKKILLGLIVVVVALWVVVMVRGGALIREGINKMGPKVLGVPVTVEDVSFLPMRGIVQIKNLHVGNPEGFKTDGVFDLGFVEVKIKSSSLFSDTVVIEAVKIDKPTITYERGLGNSNIGALLDQLEGARKSPAKSAETPGKQVIIRDLLVDGAAVKISLTVMQGVAAPIPLPQVHLEGIGEEAGGTSFGQALGRIIRAILGAVTGVVTGAGKLVGDGASAVGGAALDGASAVGGAALDGVKSVGGVVGGAAGAVTEGLGSLLPGKKKPVPDEPGPDAP